MSSIIDNFSCFDSDLSHDKVTEEAWSFQSEGIFHKKTVTAVAVIQLLVLLIGLTWNFIVAAIIFYKKLFKEPSYVFLLSLVISDLLVCVLSLPFNVASGIQRTFTIGTSDYSRCQACHAIFITTIILLCVSLFSLALMSADRLFYIMCSFIYSKYITPARALVAIVITGIFCFMIAIPPLFGFGEIKFINAVSTCSILYSGRTRVTANINYALFLSLIATIPISMTVIVNIWLLVIACKSVKKKHSTVLNNNSIRLTNALERETTEKQIKMDYHKKQIHLAKVFGTIFGANICVWFATVFIIFVTSVVSVPDLVLVLVFLSSISLSAIHPMLETCLLGRTRTTLIKHICHCCRTPHKGQTV